MQSEQLVSNITCNDDEDALFNALEDRIDAFLDEEGIFVSHPEDAKALLFDPFVTKRGFSLALPTTRPSLNLTN